MEAIRENVGEVLVNHEVQQILVEGGRAAGVTERRNQGRGEIVQFRSPVIVSDAGAANTFMKLLRGGTNIPFRAEELKEASMSAATLYIGFKSDPRELGFRGENHWIFDSLDHDETMARSDDLLTRTAHMCHLSFPSLKDSCATKHTAELLALDVVLERGAVPRRGLEGARR